MIGSFLQSWTSTGYFSNSTGSFVTRCRFYPIIDANAEAHEAVDRLPSFCQVERRFHIREVNRQPLATGWSLHYGQDFEHGWKKWHGCQHGCQHSKHWFRLRVFSGGQFSWATSITLQGPWPPKKPTLRHPFIALAFLYAIAIVASNNLSKWGFMVEGKLKLGCKVAQLHCVF